MMQSTLEKPAPPAPMHQEVKEAGVRSEEAGADGDPFAVTGEQYEAPAGPLTFETLRQINRARSAELFPDMANWSLTEWAFALIVQTSAAVKLMKPLRDDAKKGAVLDLAHELADLAILLDLVASALDIRLEDAIRQKFNVTSIKLMPAGGARFLIPKP